MLSNLTSALTTINARDKKASEKLQKWTYWKDGNGKKSITEKEVITPIQKLNSSKIPGPAEYTWRITSLYNLYHKSNFWGKRYPIRYQGRNTQTRLQFHKISRTEIVLKSFSFSSIIFDWLVFEWRRKLRKSSNSDA